MFALAKTGPKNLWAEKIATKLKISVSSKYCDIITHGSLAAGGDSCYLFAILKRWNFCDIHLKSNIFSEL